MSKKPEPKKAPVAKPEEKPVVEVREKAPETLQVIPPLPPPVPRVHKHEIVAKIEEAKRVLRTGIPIAADPILDEALALLKRYND